MDESVGAWLDEWVLSDTYKDGYKSAKEACGSQSKRRYQRGIVFGGDIGLDLA